VGQRPQNRPTRPLHQGKRSGKTEGFGCKKESLKNVLSEQKKKSNQGAARENEERPWGYLGGRPEQILENLEGSAQRKVRRKLQKRDRTSERKNRQKHQVNLEALARRGGRVRRGGEQKELPERTTIRVKTNVTRGDTRREWNRQGRLCFSTQKTRERNSNRERTDPARSSHLEGKL